MSRKEQMIGSDWLSSIKCERDKLLFVTVNSSTLIRPLPSFCMRSPALTRKKERAKGIAPLTSAQARRVVVRYHAGAGKSSPRSDSLNARPPVRFPLKKCVHPL